MKIHTQEAATIRHSSGMAIRRAMPRCVGHPLSFGFCRKYRNEYCRGRDHRTITAEGGAGGVLSPGGGPEPGIPIRVVEMTV